MRVHRYAITLEHARGRLCVETTSTSWQSALRAVLNCEGAPLSAVLAIADRGAIA